MINILKVVLVELVIAAGKKVMDEIMDDETPDNKERKDKS